MRSEELQERPDAVGALSDEFQKLADAVGVRPERSRMVIALGGKG